MTVGEAEGQIGVRGNIRIDSNNRSLVKKWLVAQGFPAMFTVGLSIIELAQAYNKLDGSGLDALRRKLAKGEDDGLMAVEEPAAVEPAEKPLVLQEQPAALPMDLPEQGKPKSAAELLREMLLQGYQPPMDEAKVRAIVNEAVAGIKPHRIEVKHHDKPAIVVDGLVHPQFERIVNYLSARGPNGYQANILLVGPAGCGKSTLINQVGKALNTETLILAGSGGVTEGDIVGKTLPVDGGAFKYQPSRFVELFERGNATIGLDEVFGFDPNCALSLNMPLSNGAMYVQQRVANPMVKRGENVNFIGTDNTYGTGADPLYVGRNAGDAATNDRWLVLTVDYDKRIEESIGAAGGLSQAEMAGIWEMRDRCRESRIRRFIGTRAFQKAAIMKQCGDSWRQIRDTLVEGWTKDEKAKVGA
jgi:energy-coupling factor transporter ATP-binding protein EcfA2